jgi:hypothetical protein
MITSQLKRFTGKPVKGQIVEWEEVPNKELYPYNRKKKVVLGIEGGRSDFSGGKIGGQLKITKTNIAEGITDKESFV